MAHPTPIGAVDQVEKREIRDVDGFVITGMPWKAKRKLYITAILFQGGVSLESCFR